MTALSFPVNWLIASLLLLVLGIFLSAYLQGAFRHHIRYRLQSLPDPETSNFALTVASLTDSFLTWGQPTGFWLEADAIYAARLNAIQQAQQIICFETFIMTPGRRAEQFADAIAQRARAGVTVQMVVDHHGTETIPQKYWQKLRAAGVEVRFFSPLSWRSPVEYLARTHRKLLLIDHTTALIGGAGISDAWDGQEKPGHPFPWLDFEVRFTGQVVARLEGLFLQHWLDTGGTVDLMAQPNAQTSLVKSEADSEILVTAGEDPTTRNSPLRSFFLGLICAARQRIWIASPYLFPDHNTRAAIVRARQRGVEVRILTMGKICDKPMVHYTAQELYGKLLTTDVNIYEYQPSMMHSKVILVDDTWVSIGSANFDPRSFCIMTN